MSVHIIVEVIFTLVCLKVMRIVEGLEGKGFRLPLTKGEAELSEKLTGITRQVCVISIRFNFLRFAQFDAEQEHGYILR